MARTHADERVAVVDYGLGNLFSMERALICIGVPAHITSSPEDIPRAKGLILPGVGAFGDGVQHLRDFGLFEPIQRFAECGRPLLGICLGMQLLFSESDEFGLHQGLGLISGRVKRLHDTDPNGGRVKVPLIGWSQLHRPNSGGSWNSTILQGLSDGEAVYFVHSYVPFPDDESATVAQIKYGGNWYCAAAQRDNVVGLQFHPEKSGEVGLNILRNFARQTNKT